jgi:oxygen-dependent protoporphyrinogen oxidase
MRTAIIGGGIAGLAAAYELEKARAAGAPVEYTLFESREKLGGSLATEIFDGVVLERGPDSFLTEKPAAAELCRELGLAADLVPSNDAARKTCIVVKNKLVPLPDGLMFLVPTKLIPTAMTRLFSLPTKIRMGLELFHPPRPSGEEDEAVATLVERHFGREAVDRLADPLLSGIYGGDSTQLSARAVLPRLVEMETELGSLTRGMLAAHRKMRAKAKEAAKSNGASNGNGNAQPAPRPIFTTLRGGMQQLVDAIQATLNPAWLRLETPVSALKRVADGWLVEAAGVEPGVEAGIEAGIEARGVETGLEENYDSVIVSSPAWAAGVLLAPVDATLGEDLAAIPYSSSITVNLLYNEAALGALPDGFGFLVPASEGRAMLACTFMHRKFLGRTPPGKAVLRAFLGGMKNEALLAEPDDVLLAIVRRELNEILGIQAEPEHMQVSRWRRAMAQYTVGHQARAKRITEHAAAQPGLKLAGNAYDGIGISDCIRLGRLAAKEILASQKVSESTSQPAR